MWGVLIGIATIAIVASAAMAEAVGPTSLEKRQKAYLTRLARISDPALTLDEAEDGAILARRFGCPGLERRFRSRIAALRPFREGRRKR